MLPLYDTVRTRKFPVVNIILIVANILVFLYELQFRPSALERFIFNWGMIPARLTHEPATAWITIFTAIFLHGSWLHLLGNMWFLYIFGDNVEGRMGHPGYVLFYLLCGVGAALSQTLFFPHSTIPMVGASGAIAGVLGAYFLLFPHARVLTLVPI